MTFGHFRKLKLRQLFFEKKSSELSLTLKFTILSINFSSNVHINAGKRPGSVFGVTKLLGSKSFICKEKCPRSSKQESGITKQTRFLIFRNDVTTAGSIPNTGPCHITCNNTRITVSMRWRSQIYSLMNTIMRNE